MDRTSQCRKEVSQNAIQKEKPFIEYTIETLSGEVSSQEKPRANDPIEATESGVEALRGINELKTTE